MTLPEVELVFEAARAEPWTVLHVRAREALSRVDEVTAVLATRHLAASPDELFTKMASLTVARALR